MLQRLNPSRLTPAASINRVRIVSLPNVELETEVRGKLAYDLLSSEAVAEELERRRDRLGLTARRLRRSGLLLAFDQCFETGRADVRAEAEAVAHLFGRRLAYLVATLKRGDEVNRQARPEWDRSYWEHWSSVRRVWLGGGLMSGHFGRYLWRAARSRLDEIPGAGCDLKLAPHAMFLPLIGAACTAAGTQPASLVFDFGQSYVKRGWADYEGGVLKRLSLLPPLRVFSSKQGQRDREPGEQARELAERMSRMIVDSWRDCAGRGVSLAPMVVASIAAYVADGHLLPEQGGPYGPMRVVAGGLAGWLEPLVSSQLGHAIEVTLAHDGTAAARALQGQGHAAVIMLGTALGVGYAPSHASLRSLAGDFTVEPG